jgi:tRNA dimethylallyltransferase
MEDNNFDIIVILGPTACNKTLLAANLAYHINGEIISADSRQVYKRMNIGTGKDYNDYLINGTLIPYHLIDIREPGYKYNIYEFQNDFFKAYKQIRERNKMPVLCGGSGLYIESVIKGYSLLEVPVNEQLRKQLENKTLDELTEILSKFRKPHNKTDFDTKKRAIRAIEIELYHSENKEKRSNIIPLNSIVFGINFEREILRKRIADRLIKRLKEGMIDEVQQLINDGLMIEDLLYYGLEYKFIAMYLQNIFEYEEMVTKLTIAIQQFAKRQITWFRRMEKNGIKINWIDGNLPLNEKINYILNCLK